MATTEQRLDESRGASTRPTNIRHWVVAATALTSVLLYLDRFCVSFAEIYIKEDLGLSDGQIGWMLSAFFWTYALAQVPSGWFSDRFGSRPMLTLYVLLWSLFTALTGLAAFSFVVLILLRLGFGVAQAGAYPTSAAILSKWVPFTNRGLASSIVAVGGRVGGVLAFLLTGTLILWFVPVSADSRLQPGDVMDPARLSYQLVEADPIESAGAAESLGAELLRSMSSDEQAVIRRNAERHAADLQAALEAEIARREQAARSTLRLLTIEYWRPPKNAAPTLRDVKLGQATEPVGDVATILSSRLNEVLTSPQDWSRLPKFADLPIESEARRLLAQQTAGEQLSSDELARANRLVLQAIFPETIRKVYGAGWRPVMTVFGLAGVVVAALFWFVYRERPELHPRCNSAEVELIQHGKPTGATAETADKKVGAAPIWRLVTSRSIWLVCLQQWFTNIGWVFLVTWLPRYLRQEHEVSVAWLRGLTTIPLLCGWVGMLYGGRLTDWLVNRLGLRWGRALPMSLSRFLAMAAYLCCLFDLPLSMVLVAFSVVAFATDLGTGSVWAYNQDVGGRHVGSILGWGNMWGNLGAAVAPPLMIAVIGPEYDWTVAFAVCALSFFLSGVVALGVDATKPIVAADE
ncbi:MAG: MFS transporter [Pirellulaceae bacterium]